jgi:cytoskeleton protein RodZ
MNLAYSCLAFFRIGKLMSSTRRRRSSPPSPRDSSGEFRPENRTAGHGLSASAGHQGQAPGFELDRIGDLLRRARGQRGENLDAISAYLRIRPGFLAALENSRYEELPADAYVIGFLRSYANYLGLDSRQVIDHYRREMAGRRRRPQLNMPKPISEGRAPTMPVLAAAFLAALLIYALWYGLSSSGQETVKTSPSLPQPAAQTETAQPPENEAIAAPVLLAAPAPIPPAPDTTQISPNVPPAAPVPAQTPAGIFVNGPSPVSGLASPSPSDAQPKMDLGSKAEDLPKGQAYGEASLSARLILRVEKESWVLIADSQGNTLFDKILKPGDVYNVPAGKDLRLTTGNGSGVVLNLDGTDLPHLAPDSRLVRNVPLDPDALKAGKTQPKE